MEARPRFERRIIGLQPIVLPLDQGAMARALGFEPRTMVLETIIITSLTMNA